MSEIPEEASQRKASKGEFAHHINNWEKASPMECALAYLERGLSVLPIKRDGSKAPTIAWEPLQEKPMFFRVAGAKWSGKSPPGIAIICGAVSGGLECLDVDRPGEEVFPLLRELVQAQSPYLSDKLAVVQTPGGWHLWYLLPELVVPPSHVLASDPDVKGKGSVIIETRGEGGYALVPGGPKECHPELGKYQVASERTLLMLARLTKEEHALLMETARGFDRRGRESPPPAARTSQASGGLLPGEDYDRRGPDWADLLEPAGWVCVGTSGPLRLWRRPGKARGGCSATTGLCVTERGEELLKVFSANAEPFEQGQTYGKFRTYCLLNYGRDNRSYKQAAKALHAQGYGELPPLKASAGKGSKPPAPPKKPPAQNEEKPEQAPKSGSLASQMIRGVLESGAKLFRASDGQTYIRLQVGGHWRVTSLPSHAYGHILRDHAWRTTDESIGSATIDTVQATLASLASRSPFPEPVWMRVAELAAITYLDLGDESYRVVEISRRNWRIVPQSPVNFLRRQGMLSLPEPVHGGSMDALDSFLNVTDPLQRLLVHAWLLACLQPMAGFPLLVLSGQQGTGKSTIGRILKGLIDPNSAPLRSLRDSEQDLAISARNSWLMVFDNVDWVSSEMSNALCRLSTGGAFATRKLYADDEECVLNACRPVLLNGIGSVATKPDLLSRSLIIEPQPLSQEQRRGRAEIMADFAAVQPVILGALLDALVIAKQNEGLVSGPYVGRFPEFHELALRAAPAFGWDPLDVEEAMQCNEKAGGETAIAGDVLVEPLLAVLAKNNDHWEGSPTELLRLLVLEVPADATKSRAWPKMPACVTKRMESLAPALRGMGITVELSRHGKDRARQVTITRSAPTIPG